MSQIEYIMKLKYEITDIQHPENPKLFRIRALRDIPRFNVNAGDLGGYIEHEGNLSHDGDCWVGGSAQVYGNATLHVNVKVFDNARVYDNAYMRGDAQVFGNAHVYGGAHVFGGAKVFGNARVFDSARVLGEVEINEFMQLSGWTSINSNKQLYYSDGVTIILDFNKSTLVINGTPFNMDIEHHKMLARLKLS